MATVKATGESGKQWDYVDTVIGQGGMKDVYFAPDKSYVVGFFRSRPDPVAMQRLRNIVKKYRERIIDDPESGAYWAYRMCWPMDIVDVNGRIGIVSPTYAGNYFFSVGARNNDSFKFKGKEKQGKWFATVKVRGHLDPVELGDWQKHLQLCLNLSRSVRRLHAAGLAHSDLSYRNVLIDPVKGEACIIDIDGLVVPGLFPPEVIGTPDFIAPEVLKTKALEVTDPNRALPSIVTDQHALSTLIYMYLLYRHPLDGPKIHDMNDSVRDEDLAKGQNALFIEHPTDKSNAVRPDPDWKGNEAIWLNPQRMPYTILGPYLADLVRRAFVDGLHDPRLRPMAAEWENALVKTIDLLRPCENKGCEMKWYVIDGTRSCPFCQTKPSGVMPVFNLYVKQAGATWKSENRRINVFNNQSLWAYHLNKGIVPNEKLTAANNKRVGYFQVNNGKWMLVNEAMPGLQDATTKTPIPIGKHVELVDGMTLLLGNLEGDRLAQVQFIP